MSIQQRKLTSFTTPVSSLPDDPLMSAAELKAVFDSNAVNDIRPAFNGLIDDLCAPIEGVAGQDIHEQLFDVKRQLDGAVMGQIPDGSLASVKLADGAVTTGKLADGAVTREKLSQDALDHRLVPLEARVAKLEYDQYQLYLQSYYDGKDIPKRALFFDGFANTSMVDEGLLMVDTASKKLISRFTKNLVSQPLNESVMGFGTSTASTFVGQVFVLSQGFTSRTLKVTVMLSKVGNPADGVQCYIYQSDGTRPTTLLYTSGTVVQGTGLTTGTTPVTFTFDTVSLSATCYAVVIGRSGPLDASNEYKLGKSNSNVPDINLYNLYYYNSSTSAWNAVSSDLCLSVDVVSDYGTVYRTVEQPLYSDCSKVTLYLRRSLTDGVITPEIALYNEGGDAVFQSMSKDADYIAPAFPSSTDIEEKWDWEQGQTGRYAKLRLVFTEQTGSDYVKSYGVIAGV